MCPLVVKTRPTRPCGERVSGSRERRGRFLASTASFPTNPAVRAIKPTEVGDAMTAANGTETVAGKGERQMRPHPHCGEGRGDRVNGTKRALSLSQVRVLSGAPGVSYRSDPAGVLGEEGSNPGLSAKWVRAEFKSHHHI